MYVAIFFSFFFFHIQALDLGLGEKVNRIDLGVRSFIIFLFGQTIAAVLLKGTMTTMGLRTMSRMRRRYGWCWVLSA